MRQQIWSRMAVIMLIAGCLAFARADAIGGAGAALVAEVAAAGFPVPAEDQISGRVVDADSNGGLSGVEVVVLDANMWRKGSAVTDSEGWFLVAGLAPGSYYLKTSNNAGYVDQLYAGIPCAPCLLYGARPVSAGSEGIDFSLTRGGHEISGIVRGTTADGGTELVANATVTLYTEGTYPVKTVRTDVNGLYRFRGVLDGSYTLIALAAGYQRYLYGFGSAPFDLKAGALIAVDGNDRPNVDVTLTRPSTVSGTMRREDTGAPAAGSVRLYDIRGRQVGGSSSSASGSFTVTVGAGTYYLLTSTSEGLVDRLFRADEPGGRPCAGCDVTLGTPVIVPATGTAVTGIDFTLSPGTVVSGSVFDTNGNPIPFVSVDLYGAEGRNFSLDGGGSYTDTSGRYVSRFGLPTGRFFARTYNRTPGFLDQLFQGLDCLDCDVTEGTAIRVSGDPVALDGIDFTLTRLPDATNDTCATAHQVTDTPFEHIVTTTRATASPFEPFQSCGYFDGGLRGRSVWYRYDAPLNGTVTIETKGSNYDTVISVLTGECAMLSQLPRACNDDRVYGKFDSRLTVPVNAGTAYYFLVTDWFRLGGTLALHVKLTPGRAIRDLVALLMSYNLNRGVETALDQQLQHVLAALEAANGDQREDASPALGAFINAVDAQRGKALTEDQADALVAVARRILASIE